jgi:hypothetical protein
LKSHARILGERSYKKGKPAEIFSFRLVYPSGGDLSSLRCISLRNGGLEDEWKLLPLQPVQLLERIIPFTALGFYELIFGWIIESGA